MGFHDRCTVALETTRRVGLSPSCLSWSSGSDSSSMISLLSSPLFTASDSTSESTRVCLFVVDVPDFGVGFLDDDDELGASFVAELLLLLLVEVLDVGFLDPDVEEAGFRDTFLPFELGLLVPDVFA